jgi:hypothetical protein
MVSHSNLFCIVLGGHGLAAEVLNFEAGEISLAA